MTWRTVGAVADDVVDRLRRQLDANSDLISDPKFRREIVAVCNLGPRAVAEMAAQFGAKTMQRNVVEQIVSEFAAIDPEAMRLAGGDQFPPTPLHVVEP